MVAPGEKIDVTIVLHMSAEDNNVHERRIFATIYVRCAQAATYGAQDGRFEGGRTCQTTTSYTFCRPKIKKKFD
jgi:hypothetical protein